MTLAYPLWTHTSKIASRHASLHVASSAKVNHQTRRMPASICALISAPLLLQCTCKKTNDLCCARTSSSWAWKKQTMGWMIIWMMPQSQACAWMTLCTWRCVIKLRTRLSVQLVALQGVADWLSYPELKPDSSLAALRKLAAAGISGVLQMWETLVIQDRNGMLTKTRLILWCSTLIWSTTRSESNTLCSSRTFSIVLSQLSNPVRLSYRRQMYLISKENSIQRREWNTTRTI